MLLTPWAARRLLAGTVALALALPGWGRAAEPLHDMGAAPAFAGISGWLNSPPLTMAGLRGHVVLVDFWAYSCINCIRTLPFLTRWAREYKDRGLVIVGVHAPEFAFEHDAHNVQAAIDRFGIDYPVAQDNDLATWKAFNNEFWPAEYLIDRTGHIVYKHAGEGDYDVTENAIRTLLSAGPAVGPEAGANLDDIGSPEMYFGLERVEALASPEAPKPGVAHYSLPAKLRLNNFGLSGDWNLSGEMAVSAAPGGSIVLHCRSGKVFMVASAQTPTMLAVTVDGKPQPGVTVQDSKLYTLFDSKDYSEHVVSISVPKPGFEAFTFTFG